MARRSTTVACCATPSRSRGWCELAEETAAAALAELRAQLAEVGGAEEPSGRRELERRRRRARVASPQYLDEIGVATRRLEAALGEQGASPFTEAMKQAGLTIDGLAADIESHYKLELD